MIPLTDLKRQYETLRGELEPVVLDVLAEQQFILGPRVAAFEQAVCETLGFKAAVGVSSASDGLVLSLLDAGVQPGDEVITTPLSFVATAEAIARVQAIPVFVDVEEESLALSPETVRSGLSSRTKAVITVHLFGHVGDVQGLADFCRDSGLTLIEDAAQAMGARIDGCSVGALGEYGVFSFFPAKVLGGVGDGGMVVCDAARAARLKQLRVHGHLGDGRFRHGGGNFRLDALQAAVLHAKLPHLGSWVAARARHAGQYARELREFSGLRCPSPRAGSESAWNYYVVQADDADFLAHELPKRGVGAVRYYQTLLSDQPAFRARSRALPMPNAARASGRLLALPMFPELTQDEVTKVVQAIRDARAGASAP